ncbi:MAG: OmpA family protein [Actinobacteria bacterium]|nr:OmpA family protein [Actinomycetota bacterium]
MTMPMTWRIRRSHRSSPSSTPLRRDRPRPPGAPTAPDDLVDPTPSWSAVLRPGRPLAPKDTEARQSQRPAAPANARQDNPGPAAGGGQNGNGPNDGDWDDSWQEPAPPARRWWWAVLVALVVVAAGALVLKTTNNDSGDDASLTTEVVDTTPDTMFEDPDATDPVVDTTPDTSVAPVATDSLLVTAERTNSLATFLAAVKAAGLDTDLAGPGPYTVFAPTDDAFNKLDPEVLKALLADKDLLTKILRHHMVDGAVNAEDLTEGNLTALDGTTILVATATDITLDKTVRPVDTDIAASNGVLHTIDTVLLPPDMDPTALLPTTTTLPAKRFFTVYFGTKTRVLDDAAKAEIASAAEAIKSFPAGSEVVITGYTLKSGSVGHRKFIAKLRATTVIDALKKAGATNVTYRIVTVINLSLSGDRVAARRAEITLPGYDPAAASTSTTTSTSMPSSTTTTSEAP